MNCELSASAIDVPTQIFSNCGVDAVVEEEVLKFLSVFAGSLTVVGVGLVVDDKVDME